jgi:hypothetical protein
MSKYLKKFETQDAYEAAYQSLILPNVSLTVDNNTVHYNPSTPVPPTPTETRVVAKFNVTSTSSPTRIGYNQYISGFSEIEIDGVVQPSVVSAYTFSTAGEHTVKYTLKDSTSIGYSAFNQCSGLTSIDIPDSVTSIGGWAFNGCRSLTTCTIGSGVISIGDRAFNGCSGLTSIEIPSGVTSIGSGMCSGCTSLTSVTIPDSVTSIGNETFVYCTGLTTCTIGSGVTSIGNKAFTDCSGLTSVTIPDSITSIGNSAFTYCHSLTSVTIPDSVTSIGDYAFFNCSRLTSATVRATTPPTLGSNAFVNNPSNRKIYVPSASVETYKSASGWSSYASRIQAIP